MRVEGCIKWRRFERRLDQAICEQLRQAAMVMVGIGRTRRRTMGVICIP